MTELAFFVTLVAVPLVAIAFVIVRFSRPAVRRLMCDHVMLSIYDYEAHDNLSPSGLSHYSVSECVLCSKKQFRGWYVRDSEPSCT